MPAYKRGLKIGSAWNYREAALGSANTKGKFTDKDFGKPLKLVSDSTYDVCADGDEIEEIFTALAAQQSTVNDGFQIGTIYDNGQFLAIIKGATVAKVGDYVVAAAQNDMGVTNAPAAQLTTAFAFVKPAGATKPTFKWRIVSIKKGNGSEGSQVLCEKVS